MLMPIHAREVSNSHLENVSQHSQRVFDWAHTICVIMMPDNRNFFNRKIKLSGQEKNLNVNRSGKRILAFFLFSVHVHHREKFFGHFTRKELKSTLSVMYAWNR